MPKRRVCGSGCANRQFGERWWTARKVAETWGAISQAKEGLKAMSTEEPARYGQYWRKPSGDLCVIKISRRMRSKIYCTRIRGAAMCDVRMASNFFIE